LQTSHTGARILRVRDAFVAALEKCPWLGWAGWLAMCAVALGGVSPKRFGATFEVYIVYAQRLFAGEPLYDATRIDAYLYWPVSLVVLRPFLGLDLVVAAMIVLALSAALLSWASYRLMQALLPEKSLRDVVALTGFLLLINIPAAWFNFKQVQAQVFMTAGMMLAAAAMMRGRWNTASLWLFVSALVKPLSIVMMLLCGVLQPRMRPALAAALVAGFALPFAFAEADYLIEQYRAWVMKLLHLSGAPSSAWLYQADFASMLHSFGVVLPGYVATAIRLGSAVGTLFLAWRIAAIKDRIVFPLAVLILSGCYCTLFGPRNEFLSFLILTPALTALGLFLLVRDRNDRRGWLLILASLILGFSIALTIDRALKPAVVTAIYVWLIWLTREPHRWSELVGDKSGHRATGRTDYDVADSERDYGNDWSGGTMRGRDPVANRRRAD
jgi:hypothetical protein